MIDGQHHNSSRFTPDRYRRLVGGDEMSHNAYSTALVNGCLVLQRGTFAGLTVLVSGVCGLG